MNLPGLYQKTDTGVYYFQPPQIKGLRPKPVSLGTKDEAEAINRYLDLKRQATVLYQAGKASFELKRYLKSKTDRHRHADASARNAEGAVTRFIQWAGNKPVGEYNQSTLEAYRDHLQTSYTIPGRTVGKGDKARKIPPREVTRTPATIRSEFGWLSSWFAWMRSESLIQINPVDAVELPKTVHTRAERYCTRDEREKLLKAADLASPDIAFVYWTGFFLGLRLNEIIEARVNWFDLSAGVMVLQRTATFTPKDKHCRTIPMSERFMEWLKKYPLPDDPDAWAVRPNKQPGKWRTRWECKKPFKAVTESTRLPWVTAHTLRHTYATLHVMAGTPIPLVAKWLGDDEKTTYHNYVGYTRQTGHHSAID